MTTNPVILLAEDNEEDIAIVQKAFACLRLNYTLKTVRDGEETISYLNGEGAFTDRTDHPFPAMLILDLNMPRKTGWEVLDFFRSQKVNQHLFVAILTSFSQQEPSRDMFEFHGQVCIWNWHLLKPVTTEAIDMLVSFFERWKATKK